MNDATHDRNRDRNRQPEALAGDSVSIKDLLNSRNTVIRLHGDYRFEDLETEGPLQANWEFRPETAGFSIHGKLAGTAVLECMRCLTNYPVPLSIEVNERYVFDQYVDPTEREKELQAEDFFEVISEEGELDLKDLAHQFILLEAESHAFCGRPKCDFVDRAEPAS